MVKCKLIVGGFVVLLQTPQMKNSTHKGEEGQEEGRQQEAANLVIRLQTKRFGELFQEMRSHISSLPLPVLEDLSEALLDFTSIADVQAWLEA